MNRVAPTHPAVSMAASSPSPGAASLAATLRAMQLDPVAHRTLMAWQATAVDAVTAAIDSLAQQLAGAATLQGPQPARIDPYDVIQARAQARRRQTQLEQCRQLAQDMVLASLHHLDDPHWDPLSEQEAGGSTASPPPPPNLLLALLTLEPPPD